MKFGVEVGWKGLSLILVVQVSLGGAESIRKFGFRVRLLGAEETDLPLDPTEPVQVVQTGLPLQRYCPHLHPVLSWE